MKTKLLLVSLLLTSALSYSQNKFISINNELKPYSKYALIDLYAGANFDLSHSGSSPNAGLLGTRPDVAPLLGIKFTHLFSKRVGWYANIQMNFYKDKQAEAVDQGFLGSFTENLADVLFWPVSIMRPSVDAGLVYRFEQQKWRIYPSFGVGYVYHLRDRGFIKSSTGSDEVLHTVEYKQRASSLTLNMGVSANYYFSSRKYLFLSTNFVQPLQKSSGELVRMDNDVETERISYKTITGGRALNVSVGLGFAIGR